MAKRPETDSDAIGQLWKRLGDTSMGMLWVTGSGQHPQPMTHMPDNSDNALWFITATDTDLASAVSGDVEASFIYQSEKGDYQASIKGHLTKSKNGDKLDELWSAPVAAWFEGGKEDPRVCLLKFVPSEAAIWTSDASPFLVGLKMLRAAVGDGADGPDVGSHRVVSFAEAA